jgi:hypothetical protein
MQMLRVSGQMASHEQENILSAKQLLQLWPQPRQRFAVRPHGLVVPKQMINAFDVNLRRISQGHALYSQAFGSHFKK